MSKTIFGMSKKQAVALAEAQANLPPGWNYSLCMDEEQAIWGVCLDAPNGKQACLIQEPVKGECFHAEVDPATDQKLVRPFINRVALALWDREPEWIDVLNE
jgi:hypothetical protein